MFSICDKYWKLGDFLIFCGVRFEWPIAIKTLNPHFSTNSTKNEAAIWILFIFCGIGPVSPIHRFDEGVGFGFISVKRVAKFQMTVFIDANPIPVD